MQLFILFCIYFLYLPYMFRALISPSSGVSQAVFYIQPFGSCGVYVAHLRVPVDWFVVVVSLYWCRGGSPVLVALRVPVDWFVVVVLLIPFLLSLVTTRFIYDHLVHVVFMLLICVCLWTGLSWWFHCTGAVVVLLY